VDALLGCECCFGLREEESLVESCRGGLLTLLRGGASQDANQDGPAEEDEGSKSSAVRDWDRAI
jgi:hypothetical protein